jgi:molecular chaperone DnaK
LVQDGTKVSDEIDSIDPEGESRRRHPRVPIRLQVDLRFASVQQFLSAYAEDISESGMFIRGWEHKADGPPHQVGDTIALRFDAGEERIVQGTARVVRIIGRGGTGDVGLGVEFVELDAQSKKLVEAIVRIKLATTFGG